MPDSHAFCGRDSKSTHRLLEILFVLFLLGGIGASAVDPLPASSPKPSTSGAKARPSTPAATPGRRTTPEAERPKRNAATPKRATPEPSRPVSPAPAARPEYHPARRPDGRRVVALDIGHTVKNPGCYSATGVGEFIFNKRIVELLAARLRESTQFAPVVINPEGKDISLFERPRVAARAQAELFLAIHHDSALDKYLKVWEVNGIKRFYADDFKGYGVFMSMKNPQAKRSLEFARLLGSSMSKQGFVFSPHHHEPAAGENRPILDENKGVYQYDDLVVLKGALMPAVLLECGVIINRNEEKALASPETQAKIVEAIVRALEEYFKPVADAERE